MEVRSLKYLTEACGGELIGGSQTTMVSGISTDSRTIRSGELFIALKGDKFDGHNFINNAIEKSAGAVIVERSSNLFDVGKKCAVIYVNSTRKALGDIAQRYRKDFNIPIIAVCGSNGKSTTKELIASVLSSRFKVHKSPGSFNNDIGVPITLLGLEQGHQIAVVEVGTNHPGELKPLIEMINPLYGAITGIGREHLGFFGTMEAVVEEEGTLAEFLPSNGKLFICPNSDWAGSILTRSRAPVITVGLGGTSNWRASVLRVELNRIRFFVQSPTGNFDGEYELNLTGEHQVTNALLAIAIGAEFKLTSGEIRRGLKNVSPPAMRMQIQKWRNVYIINDAYNANPESVAAALKTLGKIDCSGKKIAVLGTMAELGNYTEQSHKEVGELAARLGIDRLIAVGEFARLMADTALKNGLRLVDVCPDAQSAAQCLKSICSNGDVVLIKASRSAKLEKILEYLNL